VGTGINSEIAAIVLLCWVGLPNKPTTCHKRTTRSGEADSFRLITDKWGRTEWHLTWLTEHDIMLVFTCYTIFDMVCQLTVDCLAGSSQWQQTLRT